MLRRLHPDQPESFAFTPANLAWAKDQIAKYPEGRAASAVIPLLWRAQEQEGWVSKPAIEAIAEMLGMANIRVFEVASFYFMFQLKPVGTVAHVQVCGTTSCMICGAEDLIAICKEKIAAKPHEISADGKFSWEEVECLGACSNAPMAQIGKDYYEDLTEESFAGILDALADGNVPPPGPQNGRFASEPKGELTSLTEMAGGHGANASVERAASFGDTVMRILEPPVAKGLQIGQDASYPPRVPGPVKTPADKKAAKKPAAKKAAAKTDAKKPVAKAAKAADTPKTEAASEASPGRKPEGLKKARGGKADDLKRIKGIGPKLEKLCHRLGFFHFDQVAAWTQEEISWVDANLEGFKGRVTRDNWVAQAKDLAEGA